MPHEGNHDRLAERGVQERGSVPGRRPSGVHHSPLGLSERPGRNGTFGPPISSMATMDERM